MEQKFQNLNFSWFNYTGTEILQFSICHMRKKKNITSLVNLELETHQHYVVLLCLPDVRTYGRMNTMCETNDLILVEA